MLEIGAALELIGQTINSPIRERERERESGTIGRAKNSLLTRRTR